MSMDHARIETSTHNDLSDADIAEARLRQEAHQMRSNFLTSTRGMRDITKDFNHASQNLQTGQLVKDEYFTLFEAVGALEIMDPKMDSGCIPPGDTFEPEFDVCDGLNAAEVLWIMDELSRLETSFLDGYPLSQNLFTSLHMMRLVHPNNKPPYQFRFEGIAPDRDSSLEETLVNVVLRAYCVAVVKSIQLVLDVIQSYTYYEEEDFISFLFGRDLLPQTGIEDAAQVLMKAKSTVQASGLPANMKQAFTQRLSSRELFLTCLEDGHENCWENLRFEVERIKDSHTRTVAIPQAFSDKVQRQLATSTPPRPMPQLSWEEACNKWTQLCDDMLAISSLTSAAMFSSPYCLQRATWAFAYRQPAPTTLARARMQEVLMRDDSVAGEISHFDLMLADIKDLVLAGDPLADIASFQVEVVTDPRHRASRLIDGFMQRAVNEYLNLYRMVCQNRCRMRRTFTQSVPLLDEIESDAIETDRKVNEIVSPRITHDESGRTLQLDPLTLWARNHKLNIIEWIIQLGFETDLYLPREMGEMYLTLREIADTHSRLLEHILGFIHSRSRYLETVHEYNYQEQSRASQEFVRSLWLRSSVTICISDALSGLYCLLERLGIIDTSKRSYEDEQLRYEARMKPFLGLSHTSVPDLNFLRECKTQRSVSLVEACSDADSAVKQARSYLTQMKVIEAHDAKYVATEEQWKREIKSLETVCVAISVSTSQLRRILEKHKSSEVREREDLRHLVELTIPHPGSRYHDWWVVPQFKAKQ